MIATQTLAPPKPKSAKTANVWTYDRMLRELPAESRYELIDGELYKMPSPTHLHQRVTLKLVSCLISSFRDNKMELEVVISPMDLILPGGNVVQPDFFVLDEPNPNFEGPVRILPVLVAEVLSPTSHNRDFAIKASKYAKAGVQEYWLIDPKNQFIEIYKLVGEYYELHALAPEETAGPGTDTSVTSAVFPFITIKRSDAFGPELT